MTFCRWLALWLLASASAAGAEPDAWDRFRGPNGTGLSDAKTVPVSWTDRDYNWKAELPGRGHGSPVVWGNRVFLICADADAAQRSVICLGAGDGRIAWRRDYPLETYKQHRANGYATASPAVDSHGVVVTWSTPAEVVLLALDHDGRETWHRGLGPFIGPHGSGTSPVIVNDTVVLANEQEDYRVLYSLMGRKETDGPAGKSFWIAVNRTTGETKWQLPRTSTLASYSTPCLHRPNGGRPELIFTDTSHGITAVDVATGAITWQVDDVFEDRCVGSPVAAAGLVLAAYGHGASGYLLLAVRPGSTQREPEIVYRVEQSVPLVPTPLVVGRRLFLWSDDGIVTCLDVSTGRLIWRNRVGGNFFGSPICVDGRLYCIAKDGEVVVLAASDEFEELARVSLDEPSFSTPAVAGGVLYLRTASHLYSLGGGKPGD